MKVLRPKRQLIVCWAGALGLLLALDAVVAKGKPISAKDEIEFGVKMAEQDLWSEALFRFQQAEKMGAEGPAVFNNMAVAYEALGVFDKAREYYQKALTLDRDSPSLRRNYSRFVEFYQAFSPEGEGEGEEDEESDDVASGEPEEGASEDPAGPASDS